MHSARIRIDPPKKDKKRKESQKNVIPSGIWWILCGLTTVHAGDRRDGVRTLQCSCGSIKEIFQIVEEFLDFWSGGAFVHALV